CPPAPSTMPDTVVERLFEPVVSDFAPSVKRPASSIEPKLVPADANPEMSTWPPAFAIIRAAPPEVVLTNDVTPPSAVVILALPALLLSLKDRVKLLVMMALSAVLLERKPRL